MIPDISQALNWLEQHPNVLSGICRGLERETLRVMSDGQLAGTPHPAQFGSALTHKWITTDFAEAMLEFITPVDSRIDYMLQMLRDIHRHVSSEMHDEYLWPFSMPCRIASDEIVLAQYGTSNQGRFKTLYREGLKNRYGALMQLISGVHYNFSLPMSFWQAKYPITDDCSARQAISDGYLCLIRNYYRFGWVIPYLFGASAALCRSFLQNKASTLPFETSADGNFYYLPWATSLRLSDLGYTSKSQSNLGITFNRLDGYVAGLRRALHTPYADYQRMGLMKNGQYLQLNSHILQIENEFYAPVRPKRVTLPGESPSAALLRGGIEYIEVRSLDINPFSPIGVDEQQIRFLDLFLIWCVLVDAPQMSSEEMLCTRNNWNRVILEGRKPGLTLGVGCETARYPLAQVGKDLFVALQRVAHMLDSLYAQSHYQQVCEQLVACFDNPDLTYSARMLNSNMIKNGMTLARQYREQLRQEPLEVISAGDFSAQRVQSVQGQCAIEAADEEPFDQWLQSQF